MTIPRNKNITKQLNSYSYVIAITLQDILQHTKRTLDCCGCSLLKIIKSQVLRLSLFKIGLFSSLWLHVHIFYPKNSCNYILNFPIGLQLLTYLFILFFSSCRSLPSLSKKKPPTFKVISN